MNPALIDDLAVPEFLQRPSSTATAAITPVQAPAIAMPNGGRLEAIADEVRRLHQDVQDGLRRTLPQAIRIGELLTEAKNKMSLHGGWLPGSINTAASAR